MELLFALGDGWGNGRVLGFTNALTWKEGKYGRVVCVEETNVDVGYGMDKQALELDGAVEEET